MTVKILQVCYVYPPSFSGYGKQLESVNNFFSQDKDVRIEIITAYNGNLEKNVNSFYSFSRKPIEKEKYDYYKFAFFSPFKFLNKIIKCDVVHIVKAGPEIIIWSVISKLLRKKIIIKVAQDEVEDYSSQGIFRKLRYNCLKLSDSVVALSSKIEKELLDIGIKKNSIIRINNSYKPYNKANDDTAILNFGVSSDTDFKVIFVGSLCKRKGVHDLLNALSKYDGNRNITLLLVGPDYNDIDNLNTLISNVELNSKCSVVSLGERSDAKQLISMSDLLVLPSYSEGMPNVVIESLCNGTPVLASDIPVIYDMLDDKNGRIFELGNIEELNSKLKDIVNFSFDSLAIKKDADLKYSVESVGSKYKSLYLKLGCK